MFLDLMRVFALFMMIQGHTTYDFLDLSVREGHSSGIKIWTSLRGYTAPFFMMVSGAVFTFLMLSQERPDGSNPRVKAGLHRIVTLLFWGYMLNFPIYIIWKIFTKEGLKQIQEVGIFETLFTILWISLALFFWKALTSEKDAKRQKLIKKIFREGALKHARYREALFNKKFFQQQELKNRILTSFFYGFLISIPYLIISNLLTLEEKQRALRVDVLQIIAVGLLSIMFIYFISRHKKWLIASFAFIIILVTVSAYPLIHNIDLSNLPIFMAPYLNNFDTKSMFPLTPWISYIFAGCLMGVWLSHEVKNVKFEKLIGFKLAALGLGFYFLSELGDKFERFYYGRSYFWHDSPNLIYHRVGVVLCVGAIMAFLSLLIKDLPKFMKQMSRNTLWLYVGHLILIYQVVKPIIGGQTRFSVPMTMVCVALMFVLMYFQTQIIIFIQKKGGYIPFLKGLFIRKKIAEIEK
ncbi:MAG: heparan-alpha-glucosaminide N-acetyltransferase domain-containing protein [Flavobacteriia bacterium]